MKIMQKPKFGANNNDIIATHQVKVKIVKPNPQQICH